MSPHRCAHRTDEFVAAHRPGRRQAGLEAIGQLRDWLVQEVLAAAAEIADGLSHRRRPGHSTVHREPRAVGAVRERGNASVPA